MKLSIKVHPLLFQSSLAAGGVALMAFDYLQFAIPHGKGLITFFSISWSGWLLVFARGAARKRVAQYDETWLAGLKARAESDAAQP